jgi:hypothetical protein
MSSVAGNMDGGSRWGERGSSPYRSALHWKEKGRREKRGGKREMKKRGVEEGERE